MKRVIKGKNYNFIVNCFRCGNNFCFFIEAIDLHKKTHSFINNLNCVLSEFNIGMNDNKVSESQWEIRESEGKYFFNKAVNFILDINFRTYVEKQLSIDQQLSEWNKL